MSFLHRIANIVDECKNEYEDVKRQVSLKARDEALTGKGYFMLDEEYGKATKTTEAEQTFVNLLGYGDNLEFMQFLLTSKGLEGKLDLIYVDPPFYSKADYNIKLNLKSEKLDKEIKIKQTAYTDNWEGGLEDYLRMITLRLFLMRDLLSSTGSIWMHLDWHVAHYVKLIMDEIFGADNFVNEVIWNYKSGGTSNRRFARKHDTLLFYGKTKDYYFDVQKEKSYNRGYKPYHFKGVEEFQDELGWYTMVNMKDVWQLDMVGRTSAERTGYATQKPEALLSRILSSCTKEGDICADFFGGSGTLAAVAGKMNRSWITCDMGANSIVAQKKRMSKLGEHFQVYKQGALQQEDAEDCMMQEKNLVVALEEDDSNDQFILSLKEHKPAGCIMDRLKEEDRAVVEEALGQDPLCTVDSWSVDYNFDGSVHRPDEIHYREKGKLKDSIEIKKKDVERKNISIRCLDVWGNEAKEIVKL